LKDSLITDTDETDDDFIEANNIEAVKSAEIEKKENRKGMYFATSACCFVAFGSVLLWIILFR